ncbi:MAG: hypothetical protein HYT22_02805 [Candidatus Niyogibacteria bacterium]|nr:hypothetical protein [Candidatus Niyogibacteria bacterium]
MVFKTFARAILFSRPSAGVLHDVFWLKSREASQKTKRRGPSENACWAFERVEKK